MNPQPKPQKNETHEVRTKENETHRCEGVSLRGVAMEFIWESFRDERKGV